MRSGYSLKFYLILSLLFLPIVVEAKTKPSANKAQKDLLAPQDDRWEVFKRVGDGFEFEKPVCFDVRGRESGPQESNLISVLPSEKCSPSSQFGKDWMIDITYPDGIPLIDLSRVLTNPRYFSSRKIKIDGREAVLSARRYNDGRYYDGVAWKVYTSCNSKNVYIGFVENMDAEGLKKVKEGTRGLPPLVDRIAHSFKCHEREPKKASE